MGKRLTIILSGIVAILLLSAFMGWQIVKASPQYSVYQLYQAIDQHDYEKFKQFVDVDGISNNILDKALESATEESKKDTSNNLFYQMGYNFGLGLFTSMKPQLKESMVSGIKKAVEEGDFKKEYKPKSIIDLLSVVKVKRSGKVADVDIIAQGKENLRLKMRDMNGYWQIFDMDLPLPKADTANSNSQAEAKTSEAKFGDRVDITQGWFLTVETPEGYKAADSYSTPKEGNKFVSVKITYENTTDKLNSYSTFNFKLKDNKSFSYSETYGGKKPNLESGDLESKGKVTGYLTFEIPKDSEPTSIIYNGSKSIIFTSPNTSPSPTP